MSGKEKQAVWTVYRYTIMAKVLQLVVVLMIVGLDRLGGAGVSTIVEWVLYVVCCLALAGVIRWEAGFQAKAEQLNLGLIGLHLVVGVALVVVLALVASGLLPGLQINLIRGWQCYVPAAMLLFGAGVLCHAPVDKYLAGSNRQLNERLLKSLLADALRARQKKGGAQ